jgi:hypothetical protein
MPCSVYFSIPVNEAVTNLTFGGHDTWTADSVSVPEEAWQTALGQFKMPKPFFEIGEDDSDCGRDNQTLQCAI